MTVSIVVCDGDELARRAMSQAAVDHQCVVVAEATMAVEAVQYCQVFSADAVLLGNELQGLSGLDVVAELEAAGVRVILVSNDDEALERARQAGAFFAVARGDLAMIDRALAAIGDVHAADDRRSGLDRRRGTDRREHDEWGKVVHERRAGTDRRQSERRASLDQAPAEPQDQAPSPTQASAGPQASSGHQQPLSA